MTADGVHGNIEKRICRLENIYDYDDLKNAIKTSRKNIAVVELEAFHEWDKKKRQLRKNNDSLKELSLNSLVEVNFHRGFKEMRYKIDFDDEYKSISISIPVIAITLFCLIPEISALSCLEVKRSYEKTCLESEHDNYVQCVRTRMKRHPRDCSYNDNCYDCDCDLCAYSECGDDKKFSNNKNISPIRRREDGVTLGVAKGVSEGVTEGVIDG
ncbi:unnamed protein product [Ceutorhynchus assimilis]|uniref:Uncharacterized protein n=1 Tax=Ceutorhynchus assimilis TaxID=467358 RepID=A0A9N9QIY5_9CUCU|nr:unnamed protein product [Ceutorhynchus assimilis]